MKNSTRTLLAILAVAILSCTAFSSKAQAAMITGGISLAGGVKTDTGNLNTAKAFTSFPNTFVVDCSGDYAVVPVFTLATANPFVFNLFSSPVMPLWTFTFGGLTYSFNLMTLSIDHQGQNTLTLSGAGDLNLTGFDTTPGTWVFTANQGGHTFSFSSSNAAVPEGGSAVALLGIALLGVEMLRRKLATA